MALFQNLFGWGKKEIPLDAPTELPKLRQFAEPKNEDGSHVIDGGSGFQTHTLNLGYNSNHPKDRIKQYRKTAAESDVEIALDEIINESIVDDGLEIPVDINLDNVEINDKIKDKIRDEFMEVQKLLKFNFKGSDIYREWLVDGRLYYHALIYPNNPKKGIQKLVPIDPLNIEKIKEVQKKKDEATGVDIVTGVKEYYHYKDPKKGHSAVIQIAPESIIYVPSGVLDPSKQSVISIIEKAVRPMNSLKWMENSLVIYRVSRAPERRIFYIDVGNLAKGKAENYIQGMINKYRNKMEFNAETGEITDTAKHPAMIEDFWLPRRDGRGTQVETLPAGQNLGELDDILYFRRKLYRALNIPISRIEPETQFSLGRSDAISRDEVKFQKFINKLRKKFSVLFIETLKRQVILKKIVTPLEWAEIEESIQFDYQRDSYFAELKESEILNERIRTLAEAEPLIGIYISKAWARKNILRQSDEEIEEMKKEMEVEEEEEPDEEDLEV